MHQNGFLSEEAVICTVVMILIKKNFIKHKMIIEVRGEYYGGGGKNPEWRTMEIKCSNPYKFGKLN